MTQKDRRTNVLFCKVLWQSITKDNISLREKVFSDDIYHIFKRKLDKLDREVIWLRSTRLPLLGHTGLTWLLWMEMAQASLSGSCCRLRWIPPEDLNTQRSSFTTSVTPHIKRTRGSPGENIEENDSSLCWKQICCNRRQEYGSSENGTQDFLLSVSEADVLTAALWNHQVRRICAHVIYPSELFNR